MATLELPNAELALLSSPATTRVVIPVLYAMTSRRSRAKAAVTFEGDEYPTVFHGTSRTRSFDLSCRFSRSNHETLRALLTLLDETAPAAADSRLLLRTHVGLAAGLNPAVAVEVMSDITEQPVGAGVIDLSFTVQVVQHTFEVA